MKSIDARFDYSALDTETRTFVQERAERIHNLARMTAAGMVQIGQYLTEVRERLNQQRDQERLGFLVWIDREFGWKKSSVYNFMGVFERIKLPNFGSLNIDVSALYLIAAPSTPEPVRADVMRRATNGETVTHEGTRALVQHFAETGEVPDVAVNLPALIASRRAHLPQPVITHQTAEDGRKYQAMLAEREANTVRVAAVMTLIQSINCLAAHGISIEALAAHIDRFDTPDQDWHGNVRRALEVLRVLELEIRP